MLGGVRTRVKFTPQELKMVERMRKAERLWPRMRWVLLIAGTFCALVHLALLWQAMDIAQISGLEDTGLLFYSLAYPRALLGLLAGAWCIGWAIRDWHGNGNRTLLLRLIDDCQKRKETSEHAA
jgi:hypothetical protein